MYLIKMDNKEELKKKLREKIKQKQMVRASPETRDIYDNNLKNLGIKNDYDMKKFLDEIKHLDQDKLKDTLSKIGINEKQLNNFYSLINKK